MLYQSSVALRYVLTFPLTINHGSQDCGAAAIQHWLHVHDALFADIPFLKKVTVLHYERFVLGSSQGMHEMF